MIQTAGGPGSVEKPAEAGHRWVPDAWLRTSSPSGPRGAMSTQAWPPSRVRSSVQTSTAAMLTRLPGGAVRPSPSRTNCSRPFTTKVME